jgi:hypothetical protein
MKNKDNYSYINDKLIELIPNITDHILSYNKRKI